MHIIKTDGKGASVSFCSFFRRTLKDHLFESSATLSYYFLFSVFPFAIFISAVFSALDIPKESLSSLGNFVPSHILNLLERYLSEISLGNTASLITIGMLLTIYSMGKAIQTLKRKIRLAYRVESRRQSLSEWFVSFLFVFLIMFSFYVMLIIMVSGKRLFIRLGTNFPFLADALPSYQAIGVFLATCYIFLVLLGLYYTLPEIKQGFSDVLPGTLFALTAWVLMSYLFSFYLNLHNDYSGLYGSLGTIIALLIWLFMINVILLLGAYVNSYFLMKNKG